MFYMLSYHLGTLLIIHQFSDTLTCAAVTVFPEAFKNVVRRLLEASGRGMWDADEETIDKLKSLYADADDLVSYGDSSSTVCR